MSLSSDGPRLRVLHVITSVASRHGGPSQAVVAMTKALRETGVDARILASDDDVGGRLDVAAGRWVDHGGVPTWFVPRQQTRNRLLVGFNFSPGFPRALWRFAREFDFFHVHTVFSFPATVAMLIARMRSVPFAARPMGHLSDWSLRQRGAIKRAHLALVGRGNLRAARFIHATAEMEAEEVRALRLNPNVEVIPNGVDPVEQSSDARARLRSRLGLPADARLVLFLSRLHPKKGLDFLLRGFRYADVPGSHLLVAGTGDDAYAMEMQTLAEILGLKPRIHWLGHVEGEDKALLLSGSDVFALPSHGENFGNAVVEALSAGLPVIVSKHVATHPFITTHGLGAVVDVSDEAVGRAIREILRDDPARLRIQTEAPPLVREHFSWGAAARKLKTLYEAALPAALPVPPT